MGISGLVAVLPVDKLRILSIQFSYRFFSATVLLPAEIPFPPLIHGLSQINHSHVILEVRWQTFGRSFFRHP